MAASVSLFYVNKMLHRVPGEWCQLQHVPVPLTRQQLMDTYRMEISWTFQSESF